MVSSSLPFSVGQQSAFPGDDDPRLQYSFPAPQQVPQHYSYRDPSTSYSNHPPTLPRINVSEDHSRDERWPPNHYGGTSAANRVPETVFSPVASYPTPSFHYPPQHHTQGMLHEARFSLPVDTSTSPSTGTVRRGPASVERTPTTTRSAHTVSPYSRHPPASVTLPDHPPPKKKRKRADAEQLRVLNEVYARTAFPSTEERQDLASRLGMSPRSVQIWYASYFLHHRPYLISPLGSKTDDRRCVTHIASQRIVDPDRITRRALITVDHPGQYPSHRMYRPCPCHRIDQAALVRPTNRPPTSLHLIPIPLTPRCHTRRTLNKEPLVSIGLRVGIGRVSMTVTTVVLQDVIEYDHFSHRSILLAPLPRKKKILLVVKNFLLGGIHPGLFCRFAYHFALFIAVRTVTPTRILVRARICPSLPVKRRYRAPDALSPSVSSRYRRSFPYHILNAA